MTDDPRVQQLLDQLHDSDATPEEVCESCPELLPEVRERWRQVRRVRADLDALFPPADNATRRQAKRDALPEIPGYEVEAMIGRGGMGIVFRARQLRLNRFVALKMLLGGAYSGPKELARFLREAEAVAGLRHPNIVQVHDMGDHDGRPYFTMEYVEGGSLAQMLVGTPQCVHFAAQCVAALADAVQVAHQGGIIHRDLKPANILMQRKPELQVPNSQAKNSESGSLSPPPHSDPGYRVSEFDPKIVDFGLARHFESESALTQSGAPVGTPSYMAPEQAMGKNQAIGPSVDIYSLGAVLYELLSGRPPFRGETPAETLLQVIHHDPVPPSRLNPKVPRDVETICLKCLEKDPSGRYATTAALADDLRRFEAGRPILARPVGRGERLWRWSRRNPTAAALLATALALIGLALGGGTWFVQQRAERRADAAHLRNQVGTDVDQAANLRTGFHFREARELLEQARQRLGPAGPEDLCGQVKQALADLNLAERLDAARFQATMIVGGRFDRRAAEPFYASAFVEAGLGREGDDVETVAARARSSAVRAEIVAALDDWASITSDRRRTEWLLAVACEADQNAARNRLRRPELWKDGELWKDPKRLEQLTQDLSAAELSPQFATALGRLADASGGDAVGLLTGAQARFPQDFWLNFDLGWALRRAQRWDEALSYYRAALALRSEVVGVHEELGMVLIKMGRRDDAIRHFREAVRLDPSFALARNNLGSALKENGQPDEAMSHYEEAVRLDPKFAPAHTNLGASLLDQGKLDEAMGHLQEAVRLDPNLAGPHNNFGNVLRQKGRLDEALGHFQDAVRLDPKWGVAHTNLGSALVQKGRLDEAIDHFREAVRLDPNTAGAHSNLGIVLQRKGRLDEAVGHFQDAVRLDPKSAGWHTNLGAALVKKGRLDEAINHYEQAVRLDPKLAPPHINLGLALRDKGRLDEAIGHFQEVVRLEPNLAIARRLLFSCRYDAACAAVRAAGGDDARQPRVDEAERVGLRRHALDWLRANIELTAELLNGGKAVDWSLSAWQTDPALAGVRDPAKLAKLPTAEREEWQRLWADVAAVIAADPAVQGQAFAARRDWAKAADCYARALKRGPTDEGHFWFEYAALLLLSGDRPGYVKACAHLVDRCGKDKGPRAYHVARACTLAPDAVADASLPGRLAEKELQGSREFWSLTEQGALAYRAGRFQEAVPLFEQSLRANPKPGAVVLNWLWLALANQRLEKADEARRRLGKAQAWLDQYRDGMPARAEEDLGLHLHNWLEAHVLRREAEALIQPTGRRSGAERGERGTPAK